MRFAERTIVVAIDTSLCPTCESKACVDACAGFDRGVLQLSGGVPSVDHLSETEVRRRATECLACEHACRTRGRGAIRIDVPIEGLDEYLAQAGSGRS